MKFICSYVARGTVIKLTEMKEEGKDSTKSEKNTIPDWKNALSGALNDTQLAFAVVVLFIFFVVYTFFDGVFIDNNRKDIYVVKDLQNDDCNCKSSHRNFYIVWFTICAALWVLGPFALWIFQCSNCCCPKLNWFNVLTKIHDWIAWTVEKLKSCNSKVVKEMANTILEVLKLFKPDKVIGPLKKIEDLKWLEYYDMHITGTYIKKVKFKKIKKKILKVINPSDPNKLEQQPKRDSKGKNESKQTIDGKVDLEEIKGNYCCSCRCFILYLVCLILEVIRIIAQRATVPLLMIQAFDTYAFICFTGNEYCSATAQYDIPLGQTAITFAFSVSLMVSTLTVAMLKWFKYKRDEFLLCCKGKVNCSQYKWIQSCV